MFQQTDNIYPVIGDIEIKAKNKLEIAATLPSAVLNLIDF